MSEHVTVGLCGQGADELHGDILDTGMLGNMQDWLTQGFQEWMLQKLQ